jgi:hypothetical protein
MAATRQLPMHTAGSTVASFTSPGYGIDRMRSIVAYLNVTALSGGTATLDVKIQDSPDGATWYDITGMTFTQATGATSQRLAVGGPLGAYVRAVCTQGAGSTSNYTLDAVLNEV